MMRLSSSTANNNVGGSSGSGGSGVHKPLPLKQRTSSVDARRDYSTATWLSVLGLLKVREYFIVSSIYSQRLCCCSGF